MCRDAHPRTAPRPGGATGHRHRGRPPALGTVGLEQLGHLLVGDVVADWISRGYYGQLLAAGVRILRFKDAMVHAKTSTIDGTWSTVGTANVDRLSLQGNYEINVEVID